ncbi:MAG: hypothetical protein AAFW98_04120 [Pseudomonadota bacterium]
MTALAPIPPKIKQLIPLLASNQDGEVVAAVRAINRTLSQQGLDFHDLAAAACVSATAKGPTSTRASDLDPEEWREVVLFCADRRARLSNREAAFVTSILYRVSQNREPTPKQAKWMFDIYDRLRRAGHA